MFTLYQYLHCPYCVRADMIANYSGVTHKKVYLLNDDIQTGQRLIGAKMVPILQYQDGSAIGESLDIVGAILAIAPNEKQLIEKQKADSANALFSEYRSTINQLVFPRNIMLEQPEFTTTSAKDYFRTKKEQMMGVSFADAYSNTPELLIHINNMLQQLTPPTPLADRNSQLSWDDVFVYPVLRNLTMVQGINWPEPLKHYLQDIAKLTDTHLYSAQAV